MFYETLLGKSHRNLPTPPASTQAAVSCNVLIKQHVHFILFRISYIIH